jgi:two-component system alkaline phosphatase synthesis response regulator PhoP
MGEPIEALIVDDEDSLRFFVQAALRREGLNATGAASGEEALELLRDNRYDVTVLDLMLGGKVDGLKVLEAIRWRWPDMAVVILTAHGSLESAMAAISEGVDGYLLKPVEPAELRLAVREALNRRKGSGLETRSTQEEESESEDHLLKRGPVVMDLKKYEVTIDDRPVELTPREFMLLVYLIRNADRVISPQELVEVVRDYKPIDAYEARDIVKWYIYRLRRKVEPDPTEPIYIVNVRGVGYTFGV